MNGRVFVYRVKHEYGPLNDTVAQVVLCVAFRLVSLVRNARISGEGIVIYTLFLNPCVFVWPEQLNRVALTQIEGVLRHFPYRFNDYTVEQTAVAVI